MSNKSRSTRRREAMNLMPHTPFERILRAVGAGAVVIAALNIVSTTKPVWADMLVNPPVVAPLTNAPRRAALGADMRGRQILLGGQSGVMTVATSSDDGRTWTQPVILESTPGLYSGATLCVDRFSRAFVAWRFAASGTGPGEIHAASFRFVDAAADSIPPTSVFRLDKGFDATESSDPVLDCNEEGMALIVWEERRSSGGHDLLGAMVQVFERDRFRLMKISAPFADDNVSPDVDLRQGGLGYIVFQARFASRNDIFLASVNSASATVKKIPTEGAVVPPILVHNEIEPKLARMSALVPATSPASRELVVAWLDDRGGFFRTLVTSSSDAGQSWYTDIHLPTAPDAGACQAGQTMARICRGGAGVIAGFRCVDPTGSSNVAFTNSSRDLGATWETSPAPPLDDEDSTGLQAFELQCVEGMTPDAHAVLRVSPNEGRQHHVGGRGPDPAFVFAPHTEPADGLPQDHGQFVSLAHDEGQAWIAIDLDAAGVLAVNGTTAETRLDTECPSGVCFSADPTFALGDPPYLHAAWLSRGASSLLEIRAALSPDAGGRWLASSNAVASGNVDAPFLLATERTDMFGASPVMALYIDQGGIVTPPTLRSSLSVDRGSSWNAAGQINTTPLAGHVLISGMGAVVQGRSRFYAAWIHDNGQIGEVRFSFFSPVGGWSSDKRLDTPPGPLAGHPVGRPRVAADDQGNVCVLWEDRRDPNDQQIRVNCSTDGGMTFQIADTRLDPPDGIESADPDFATDGRGHYAVVWREVTPTAIGDTLVTRHACEIGVPAQTGGWSALVKIPGLPSAGPIHAPQITLEAGGHTVVAWDNRFGVYSNSSKDWGNNFFGSSTPLATCSAPGAPSVNCGDGVRLFAGPDGGTALAFQHEDAGGLGISAFTADDFGSGASWLGPFALTPDGGNGHEPDTGGVGPHALSQELHLPPVTLLAAWATTGNAIASSDVAANRWRMPNGVPLEMKAVQATASGGFTWEPFDLPSGTTALYNVYRGTLPLQSSSVPWSCLAAHVSGSSFLDPTDPAPGGIMAYLITGVGPGGEGPAGTRIQLGSCEPPSVSCF